jgi:hypothetical protein
MPKRKSITELYHLQKDLNTELSDDNIEQRKIIERITRIMKDWKHVLPDPFMEKVNVYINEYERRFTMISKKQKDTHPVFRDKE